MKNTLIFAALAALATPAVAQTNEAFTGPRVGVTVGVDDIINSPDRNDVVYGADVGYDFAVTDRITLGAEAFSTNVFEDTRTIGAAARLGYALNDDVLVFGRAGYANYRDVFSQELDGLTVGGGLEFSLTNNTYARAEYRYSDFQDNTGSHGALVGVGLRF